MKLLIVTTSFMKSFCCSFIQWQDEIDLNEVNSKQTALKKKKKKQAHFIEDVRSNSQIFVLSVAFVR